MVVDRAISRRTGPVVEIARPAHQHAVDILTNCLPGVFIPPAQDCADPRLEPSDTLLRRAGPEIPLMRGTVPRKEGLTTLSIRIPRSPSSPTPASCGGTGSICKTTPG